MLAIPMLYSYRLCSDVACNWVQIAQLAKSVDHLGNTCSHAHEQAAELSNASDTHNEVIKDIESAIERVKGESPDPSRSFDEMCATETVKTVSRLHTFSRADEQDSEISYGATLKHHKQHHETPQATPNHVNPKAAGGS